ncbi:MAG: hypothetical protein H0X03_02310, partial [Nitrosopumilus sp.]|nr:hypothetical protein [Nitrosopumilus sp.]
MNKHEKNSLQIKRSGSIDVLFSVIKKYMVVISFFYVYFVRMLESVVLVTEALPFVVGLESATADTISFEFCS